MFHTTSPRVDDAGIESLLQLKGKTAPRVTPADLDAAIDSEHYFTAAQGTLGAVIAEAKAHSPEIAVGAFEAPKAPLNLLTFCVLVLKNGFTVTGESACASPENFDAEVGRRVARENAKQKLWPLLGYELKTRLAEEAKKPKQYTAADIVEAYSGKDHKSFGFKFKVLMKDGQTFSGVIPEDSAHSRGEVARLVLEECNRQASA